VQLPVTPHRSAGDHHRLTWLPALVRLCSSRGPHRQRHVAARLRALVEHQIAYAETPFFPGAAYTPRVGAADAIEFDAIIGGGIAGAAAAWALAPHRSSRRKAGSVTTAPDAPQPS
jgi:hypothetical protein